MSGAEAFPNAMDRAAYRAWSQLPVRYGDHVRIGVVVEHVGHSSFRVRYEARVGERPVFVARNTMVIVDMETFRPAPIPAWLRARFEAAMEAKA